MNLKRKFPLISYSVSSQVTAGKKTPTFFQLNYEDKILKSDDQQFPQCQQNKQSSFPSNH